MRNRFFILLSALIIIALAVPAAAGGPNDNGNGMRATYEEIHDFDTDWSWPICEGGVEIGDTEHMTSHVHRVITISGKPDGRRVEYLSIGSFVSDNGAFRIDERDHQVVNSIDSEGTGLPNVYNMHFKRTWSDSDGIYAEETSWYHHRWDKDGDLTFDSHHTGLTCLRDTIAP